MKPLCMAWAAAGLAALAPWTQGQAHSFAAVETASGTRVESRWGNHDRAAGTRDYAYFDDAATGILGPGTLCLSPGRSAILGSASPDYPDRVALVRIGAGFVPAQATPAVIARYLGDTGLEKGTLHCVQPTAFVRGLREFWLQDNHPRLADLPAPWNRSLAERRKLLSLEHCRIDTLSFVPRAPEVMALPRCPKQPPLVFLGLNLGGMMRPRPITTATPTRPNPVPPPKPRRPFQDIRLDYRVDRVRCTLRCTYEVTGTATLPGQPTVHLRPRTVQTRHWHSPLSFHLEVQLRDEAARAGGWYQRGLVAPKPPGGTCVPRRANSSCAGFCHLWEATGSC